MNSKRHEVVLPDFGLREIPVTASCWLVPLGGPVVEGDCMLEVLAGEVTIDVSADVSGTLVERCVEEDDRLVAGQLLGAISEADF